MLTVHEHLSFQARLRLPSSVGKREREDRIAAILHELGLWPVRNTRIGEVGQGGISGGERRRLSFATEIISNPSLIFLDEPTSGLDSYLAESIVTTLSNMARNGRTLVCTIHQVRTHRFICIFAHARHHKSYTVPSEALQVPYWCVCVCV